MKRHLKFIAIILVLLICSPCFGNLTVVYPDSSHHTHSSTCPSGDGSSHLVPDPVENADDWFILTSISQKIKDELASGDTTFPGWTFNYNTNTWGTANGTLFVDIYESVFYSNHSSGAHLQARYVKGSGDPTNLRWIQYVDPENPFDPDQLYDPSTGLPVSNGPIAPADGGFIDPYTNDGTDGGPFYWHGGEIGNYTSASDAFGSFDLKFDDNPRVFHPPVSSNGMAFELYLVSWNGIKTVDFLGGIEWGFEGECVPDPASLTLSLIGLGCASWWFRRRKTLR